MTAAPHLLAGWDAQPASRTNEGIAFVIYPATTSEPLMEVLARDGAEQIAQLATAAPKLLELLERYAALDVTADKQDGQRCRQDSGLHREARALIANLGGEVEAAPAALDQPGYPYV